MLRILSIWTAASFVLAVVIGTAIRHGQRRDAPLRLRSGHDRASESVRHLAAVSGARDLER